MKRGDRPASRGADVSRVLFARSVDANNLNAQSRNAKEILARWRSNKVRPSALAFGEPDARVAQNPNVDIMRISDDRWWPLRVAQLYQGRFDAIFYPGIHHRADYAALRIRALSGRKIPVIATIEELVGSAADERVFASAAGHPVFCYARPPGVLRRYMRIREDADYLIAISPFLARMASTRYGDKIGELPLGIDLSLYRNATRRPRSRPLVVTAGNVRAHKRPEFFLRLAQRFPQADFTWYGEGDLRAPLLAEARSLGLTNLDFPGALDEASLARAFCAADIFVLPSKSEGLGKVTQEAAAAGLPAIVFGFYEAPTVVEDRNGFVVWSDDWFAARVKELLENSALAERMGREGHEMAQQWRWDRIAPLWEQRITEFVTGTIARSGDAGSESASGRVSIQNEASLD